MRSLTLLLSMAVLASAPAFSRADSPKPLGPGQFAKQLPANTWVELKYTTEQPSADPAEKGYWGAPGCNKIIYDPDGKRVLFL